MAKIDITRAELVWPGKYNEDGTRNEPAYVREVATRAAALCGEPLKTLARRTSENARRCFGSRLESAL